MRLPNHAMSIDGSRTARNGAGVADGPLHAFDAKFAGSTDDKSGRGSLKLPTRLGRGSRRDGFADEGHSTFWRSFMKLVKSLLLGSAAGLAVVSGASAADLPSRK